MNKIVNFDINPEQVFEWEISCIQNELHRALLKYSLHKVPDYFWTVPASSSGKYHPKSSLGTGGLVRHTKAVFQIGEELLNHPMYTFTEDEKDCIRMAILLHDSVKQGDGSGGHTVANHPLLVREVCKPWSDDDFPEGERTIIWNLVCSLIETHMGYWTKDREGNVILDEPKTEMQKFVHLCDYLASRKSIEVDIHGSKPQPTSDSKSTTWRDEPAKDTQIRYLSSLYIECNKRGIFPQPIPIRDSAGNLILTKGIASDMISELKTLLNR